MKTKVLVAIVILTMSQFKIAGAQSSSFSDGRDLYVRECGDCHSQTLRGTAHGVSLVGASFIEKWNNRSLDSLIDYTRKTMPPGGSVSLSDQDYTSILNYILGRNRDFIDSDSVLLAVNDSLANETTSWSGAEEVAAMASKVTGFENRPIDDLANVSLDDLYLPSDDSWLSWRRTLDGHGFSPLTLINRSTVKNLKLVWSLAMEDGSNQGTPLVHQGIMFLTHPNNSIQAIEVATGNVLWNYNYDFPSDARVLGGPTRNIAIYEDKIFLSTYDAALVAIDMRSGKQVWRTVKADYKDAYTHSSGPIIGNGVVLSGINGCERYTREGCFLTGHDPETGKELWRTSTIKLTKPEEEDTWGGLPRDLRAGGDSWIAGSYDPELDLFIIGTSQPKPWVAASRGMSPADKALYTNSTLALDPSTGEIVWYFQHVPGETIDMEVGFERVLIDIDKRKYVITIGKDGILWKLDSRTGEFIDLVETLPQNLFTEINRKEGHVKYRSDILEAKIGDTISVCPGIYGGHNWQASALDPSRNTLIIPLHQTCSDMTGRAVELELGGGGYGGDSATYPMPGTDENLGKLAAYNLKTMKESWSIQQRAMFLTGALTTGGGLVFIGDLDRYFKAFDIINGEELWSIRLPAPLHGYPISFGFDGKQYVAVQTGIGVFRALTATLSPDIYQPSSGQAIHVFSLD